jgi:predicted nucleotidyltransferase
MSSSAPGVAIELAVTTKTPQVSAELYIDDDKELFWRLQAVRADIEPSEVLRVARDQVLAAVLAIGGENVRVFGSVAHGTDKPDSDIDLLVTFPPGSDIVTLLALEEDVANLLTVPVDVVSAGSSGPVLVRALAESVPL